LPTSHVASDLHLGGTRVSPSYLAKWHKCPMEWYWTYLHPTEGANATGVGLLGKRPSRAMLLGSLIHEGLAALYMSAPETGQYSLEAAVVAVRVTAAQRARDWPDTKSAQDDTSRAVKLLDNYFSFYGPGGRIPEWPTVRPMVDDQGPIIERSFDLELPRCQAILTVRPDGMFLAHSFAVAMEHKSSGARNVGKQLTKMTMDGQCLSEMAVLQHHIHNPSPSGVYANILVTDRAPGRGVPCFERQLIHYNPDQIDHHLTLVHDTIWEIRRSVEAWSNKVDSGWDHIYAAKQTFPQRGIFTGACAGFFACDFLSLCSAPGHEGSSLLNYTAKAAVPNYDDSTEEN
jgi:hypothetical protein